MRRTATRIAGRVLLFGWPLLPFAASHASGIPTAADWLEEVVVTGRLDRLSGNPVSATEGIVTSEQGEGDPVADIHFHPVEPRTFRMTLTASF